MTASGSASAACRRIATSATSPQENLYADLYLLETATGAIERLTNNAEVGESGVSFSPDSTVDGVLGAGRSREVQHDATRASTSAPIADRGKPFRKLGASFDGDVTIGFWSKDGSTIYFNEGIKATNQFVALDVARTPCGQLTDEKASVSVDRDEDTGVLLINYSDGTTPTDRSSRSIPSLNASTRSPGGSSPTRIRRCARFALGQQEEITWKSKDGTMVGGVLVKPVGYQRRPALSADRRDPRRAGVGRRAVLQRRLRLAGLRRRRLRRAPSELPRLDQLRPQTPHRHRRQLLRARVTTTS